MAKQPGARSRPCSSIPSAAHLARFAALNVVMASRRLSPARAKLWVVIHGFSKSARGCFLGAAGLAFRTGMTIEGVYSALDWLQAQGLLEVVPRGRGHSFSRYAVLPLAAVPTGADHVSVEKAVRILDALLPERRQKSRKPVHEPRGVWCPGSRGSGARAVGSSKREKVLKTFSLSKRVLRSALPKGTPTRDVEAIKQQFRRAAARAREVRS